MRLLADENIHARTIEALRSLGHDVASIRADAPGTPDEDILARAGAEQRILVTYDTDFGELIFHRRLPARSGIILLRLSGTVDDHNARLIEVLPSRDDWDQYFTTVGDERVRPRRLPR